MGKHFNPMEDPFDGIDDDDGRGPDEPAGYEFQAEAMRERPKSLEVCLGATGDIKWFPKSVIHSESEVFEAGSGEGKMVIYEWFAIQEGMLK